MSNSHADARAEAIREICRQVGKPHLAAGLIAGCTDPTTLRRLAGLPPAPTVDDMRRTFEMLQ